MFTTVPSSKFTFWEISRMGHQVLPQQNLKENFTKDIGYQQDSIKNR